MPRHRRPGLLARSIASCTRALGTRGPPELPRPHPSRGAGRYMSVDAATINEPPGDRGSPASLGTRSPNSAATLEGGWALTVVLPALSGLSGNGRRVSLSALPDLAPARSPDRRDRQARLCVSHRLNAAAAQRGSAIAASRRGASGAAALALGSLPLSRRAGIGFGRASLRTKRRGAPPISVVVEHPPGRFDPDAIARNRCHRVDNAGFGTSQAAIGPDDRLCADDLQRPWVKPGAAGRVGERGVDGCLQTRGGGHSAPCRVGGQIVEHRLRSEPWPSARGRLRLDHCATGAGQSSGNRCYQVTP